MLTYPKHLSLANLPTPLTALKRYSEQFDGIQLWVKRDELTGMEVSGNKIRKLEFSLAEAQQQGCDTIITCGGIQSNHCRATAVLGARLGLKVHLILRGDQPERSEGNLLLDSLCGAQITYLPTKEYFRHQRLAADLQQTYLEEGRKAFFIPIGASDEIGLWGYVKACAELKDDFQQQGIQPTHLVSATGSGGTQAGLLVGSSLYDLGVEVLAFNVSDNAAYFEKKIKADYGLWLQRYQQELSHQETQSKLPAQSADELEINTVEGYLGPGYGRAEQPVFDSIADLARTEGLFLDPVYTGKAFHGLTCELRKMENGCFSAAFKQAAETGKDAHIVFVHTGGFFGVFPQADQFQF